MTLTSTIALITALATLSSKLIVSGVDANSFVGGPKVCFLSRQANRSFLDGTVIGIPRGGATAVDEDSEDEDYSESEEETEKEEIDPTLTKSALYAASKAKAKAKAVAKEAVSSTLRESAITPQRKKKTNLLKRFKVPYIIRASINPFTLLQMTRGYWASLFNLNYLKEVRQNLQFWNYHELNGGGLRASVETN